MISPDYLAQQRDMHARHVYGDSGRKWTGTVLATISDVGANSVLDYGCGTGAMMAGIRDKAWGSSPDCFREYDPAVPGKDAEPLPADLVTCIDVLEHIEPEHLSAVLYRLRLLSTMACFMVISTRPAGKKLPDGRNAHLIVERPPFWVEAIKAAGFSILRKWQVRPDELLVLAR